MFEEFPWGKSIITPFENDSLTNKEVMIKFVSYRLFFQENFFKGFSS